MSEPLSLTFTSDADDPDLADLTLAKVHGRAALGRPYEYTLELVSEVDQGLSSEAIDALFSAPCRFTFGDQDTGGILRELTLEPTVDPAHLVYQAVLVPKLCRLEKTVRSRVFQWQTALEIVASVLNEHGIAHQLSVLGTYPSEEYTVQYAESDFAFVSRLLEHWGAFYFFEQGPDGETMVIVDDNRSLTTSSTYDQLHFDPNPTDARATGWIGPMTRVTRPQTGEVIVRDYNWRTSYLGEDGTMRERQLQLRATRPADQTTGYGERWYYGEHFKDEPTGIILAQRRAEELMVDRVRFSASFRAPGLSVGQRFQTSGMPLADLEGEYVITEVTTTLDGQSEGGVFAQSMRAIPATVAFRPARETEKPCIHGFMHAVIDGEITDTTAAPIDELGRYKVIMPYDVAAAAGGRASRWIRMAQASAGAGYGMHLPLHVGTEVAVIHLEGDPDRPVIMGAIPNADTTSPVIADNATQSRIKTRGNIVFELEDDA